MRSVLLTFSLLITLALSAQMPMGRPGGAGGQNFNQGHFYGKIVDSKTGKGVDGASVQLLGNRMDTATKKMIPATLKAVITQSNG
ncbi:MAG TPA: hypothetical protein VF623_07280, partial [Segetibacter sp.]